MIDIIVQAKSDDLNLEKTLMSIFLQEINVPYKVTIIDTKTNKDIINRFSNFFEIEYIEDNNSNIIQIAKEKTTNPYIIFLDSNTLLYNVESIKRLYNKSSNENKNVYGILLKNNEQIQDNLLGNIFKREDLESNEHESISNIICISNEKE